MFRKIVGFIYKNLGGKESLIKSFKSEVFNVNSSVTKVLSDILGIEKERVYEYIIDVLDLIFLNRNMKQEYIVKLKELEQYKD